MTGHRAGLVVPLLLLLLGSTGAEARVFDENTQPPPGCDGIAEELSMYVEGGRAAAEGFPHRVFAFTERDLAVPACTRITVTFHNTDDSRHQWMVHGVWPNGTTLLEADGGETVTGTFVTSAVPETLLVHCGIPRHQQMGMKAQIRVDGGIGDLPNILGVSGMPLGTGHGGGAEPEDRTLVLWPIAALTLLWLGKWWVDRQHS